MSTFESSRIPAPLKFEVQAELAPDEQIVWMEQPLARPLLWPCVMLSFMGLLLTGAGIYIWVTQVQAFDEIPEAGTAAWMMPALCLLMVLAGLLIGVGSPLLILRGLRRTVYVLTNKRALALQGIFGRTIRSFEPTALGNISRKDRADGSGDLLFARELKRDSEGNSHYEPVGFLYVRNVREIEGLIRDLARSTPIKSLLLALLLSFFSAALAAAPIGKPLDEAEATTEPKSNLLWYPAQKLTLQGKGWDDTTTWSSRLPQRWLDQVPEGPRTLSAHSAGVAVRFCTDATSMSAVWDSKAPMNHMARTGSGGLDLYARNDNGWEYVDTGIPRSDRSIDTLSIPPRSSGKTEYLLYLPLYSPVTELKVGVNPGSRIQPAADTREDRLPVVFYGTSITQGGCASRSGMGHVTILGRWLDRDVINLGFSGAGRSEPVMADMIAEIAASVYVIEPLPNMTMALVTERIPGFVQIIRTKQPHTPILLVQNPLKPNDSEQNSALSEVFEKLRTEGITNLHLLPSSGQLDGRENGTVDGVHPTDLGFLRMAECYLPVLERLIPKDN